MDQVKTYEQLQEELKLVRMQLDEANEAIDAIRTGQVDALIVQNRQGHQLYTIKNADQTYRIFIEKMSEGAVTLNPDGLILYSNSHFALLMEVALEKIIGLSFFKFIAAECIAEFEQLLNKAWKKDNKGEFLLTTATGKLIPFLISLNTLELDSGLSMSIILTDLTSQKETQKKLKHQNEQLEEAHLKAEKLNNDLEDIVEERTKELTISREYFKILADNIPVIIWTAKPNGDIDYFNKRWFEYTGMTFEQTQNWSRNPVLHPEDLQNCINLWTYSLETGNNLDIEYRFKRASDNTYRWHLGNAVPVKDTQGNITAWFGTCTDIDDQKQAMEKKDEFIGVASHELKTPLTSLKGYLQLIESHKKEELPGNVSKFVSKANESLNKLQTLVNDLLNVSKIQAGKLQFKTETINLTELINNCIDNAALIYPKVEIDKQIESDYFVDGNMGQLEQVLMNLINNAVKYSPKSNRIIIVAKRIGGFAKVSVTDFGIGLSDDQKNKIFERFYRVEDKKYFTSGLGMGLYISCNIIKEHLGTIGVESKLHEGSTFYFNLPLI